MPELHFYNANGRRIRITKQNRAKIRSLYRAAAKDIQRELSKLQGRNISEQMRAGYLRSLERKIYKSLDNIDKSLEIIINDGMIYVAAGAVKDAQMLLNAAGITIKSAFSRVPEDVVARIVSGKLYQSDWSLNKAIWGGSKKIHDDISKIIAQGVAQQKSAFDIGKDLERYVNPAKAKPWNWGKVYPGTNRVIDYNAQRLARTLVTHAYQQSMIEVNKNNPYLVGFRWEASNGSRVCEICQERDGKIFPIDDLPLDHPNGMCTQVPVFDRSLKDISKDLVEKASKPLENPEYQKWREYIRQQSL